MKGIFPKQLLIALILLWTALILYGSLAPGAALPGVQWWSAIPYFDKAVHFIFYLVQTLLLLFLFDAKTWRAKLQVIAAVIIFSAVIELLQKLFFSRSGDLADLAANTAGALAGTLCYIIIKKTAKI